ncbi:sulfurtransferase [Actinosynnema mirum]|uniref:Rhodanese domain protein n=1 Tax=Actinosynnema mirum (strain ATCC 29888 / DSM 43827 / JCM 3225 / NBRC 14064 / NCIMB 13271 / NRRL B-12336 / IMRU 3971 / 101) TaxID=446462 RepID=C6WIR9_ACTMD|nr:sulfurtransferase [Actinosynnema mirum]ACU38159.1 Rhodanese domain protein [Actinosynnema mirum DSM 43827]
MTVIISATELHRRFPRFRVLDVRWALGAPDGRPAYLSGHLPGAVHVDLEAHLAGPRGPGDGRHPLPGLDAVQSALRGWGVNVGDQVVVYDDSGNLAAARAWWVLRDAGIDVRLLDGGLAAWVAGGFPVERGDVVPTPGDVVVSENRLARITTDEAATWPARGVLLDARAGERYRGEVEPVDPGAGHVPGAVSAPTGENLAPDGTFLAAPELARRFAVLGVTPGKPVAVYCGSGVTAAHTVAALAIAGIDAALYPGSWSQWSSDPDRPVEVGA